MKPMQRFSVLLLAVCTLFLVAAGAQAETLRFGYVKGNEGLLAIEADTALVICPDKNLLVLNPDDVEEAQRALGATILPDGRWQTKAGYIVEPQLAFFHIDRKETKERGNLPRISAKMVELASTGEVVCGQLIKGYHCYTTSQGGCNNACSGNKLWQNGPAVFSYCEKGTDAERCFQTAGSVTCTFTEYSGPGCTGAVISTGSQTFPNCQ